jgi:protocatechuate 3,4-dioxygenase alpha subunit
MPQATPSQPITTSQTIGPFPHEGWRWAFDAHDDARPVQIRGRVVDGAGQPVDDALIEAWVPGATTGEVLPGLPGLFRTHAVEDGAFRLSLPRHGVAGEPAAYVTVFARGLTKHQFTAVFIGDEVDPPLLAQVPAERRATLQARPADGGGFTWDLHLQGPDETVFFDFS